MLIEQIEHRWLAAFRRTLELCALQGAEVVGIVTESQSRPVNVALAELAVQSLGATPVRIQVPTPSLSAPAPVRSTGASDALQNLAPVVAALSRCQLVLDCTVEGLQHAGAPDALWRTTTTSGLMAAMLRAVSTNDSPLAALDPEAEKLMTSADSHLPAISNDVRVRVEFS